jgi:hypothetical protein
VSYLFHVRSTMFYKIGASVVASLVFLLPTVAFGQGAGSGPEPRLPGAVTTAPAWLKGAPFDVAAFFEMPPPSQNAAPLYLEALLDFGGDMAVCLPPSRRGRASAAEEKGTRIDRAYAAWEKDRSHVDRAEIDALSVVMRDALRKLDAAQVRPRCVFATGIAHDVPIPHLQIGRRAVKLWALLAARALDRGDVEGAIGYVRRILRFSEDIRPRGAAIAQVVGAAFDAIACNFIVPRILAHPRLQAGRSDQLLALLKDHEAGIADSFATGVKAEYVLERVWIRVFEDRILLTVDANDRAIEKTLDDVGLARCLLRFVGDRTNQSDTPKQLDATKVNDPATLQAVRSKIRSLNLNFSTEHRALDEWAELMFTAPHLPYAQRTQKVEAMLHGYDPRVAPAGQAATLFLITLPNVRKLVDSAMSDGIYVRAAQCLAAVRRWQLLHQGKLSGLAEMCRAAGLSRVPIDDYSGSPLRLAVVAGEPVIYSVGPDGDDDGGLKDADLGRTPDGDFLFRLPKPAAPARR